MIRDLFKPLPQPSAARARMIEARIQAILWALAVPLIAVLGYSIWLDL